MILEDLKLLQVRPDRFTRTSDHFEKILEYGEKMIRDGNAYVDDTPTETMREEREKRVKSVHRDNSKYLVIDSVYIMYKLTWGRTQFVVVYKPAFQLHFL